MNLHVGQKVFYQSYEYYIVNKNDDNTYDLRMRGNRKIHALNVDADQLTLINKKKNV